MKIMDWKASCAPGVGLELGCGLIVESLATLGLYLHDISSRLEMVFFLNLILMLPYSLNNNSNNSILIPDD